MSWKPGSWQEFRQTYLAGKCHVDFGPTRNSLAWASKKGWKLVPDLRKKQKEAIQGFLLVTIVLILVPALFGGSVLVPIIGIPVIALLCYSHATTVDIKDWEAAFCAQMLASEKDFWDAWESGGIGLYRLGDDGKFRDI